MKQTTKLTRSMLSITILILALAACGGTPDNNEGNLAADASPIVLNDYTSITSATGKVVPAQWAAISIQNAGIVEQLNASENDEVNAGDTLMVLGGTEQIEAALAATQLELIAAEQALQNLFDSSDVTAAQSLQAIANTQDLLDTAERKVYNITHPAKQTDIDSAFAALVLAQDRLDDKKENFEEHANKPETDVVRAVSLNNLATAQDAYDNAQRRYNNLIAEANEIDLAQAEANLAYAQALLLKLQIDYAELEDGPDPDLLALAEARVNNAKKQLASAQAHLDDLILKAPFSGTVSTLYVRESEWVNPGQPVLLLGDLSQLQIETTDLNEIDVARISVGSRATITFDALPEAVIEGTVVRIATKATGGSSVNYTVILEMDEIPDGLLWDMTAFVDIDVE